MTSAVIFMRRGRPYGFKVSGHSGYGDAGSDIVCAAVSAATRMCINGITQVAGGRASLHEDGDSAEIMCTLTEKDEKLRQSCEMFLEALGIELKMISSEFEDYLNVKFEEDM